MTYCPECNSEIAEIDTFCAYCGIAVNVTPVQQDVSENSSAAEPAASSEIEAVSNTPEEAPSEQEWMSTADAVALAGAKPAAVEIENKDISDAIEEKEAAFESASADAAELSLANTEIAEPSESPVQPEAKHMDLPADDLDDTYYDAEKALPASESEPIAEDLLVSPAPDAAQEASISQAIADTAPAPAFQEEEPDFGETVPYVSADYAKHNLVIDEPQQAEFPKPETQQIAEPVLPSFNVNEASQAAYAKEPEPPAAEAEIAVSPVQDIAETAAAASAASIAGESFITKEPEQQAETAETNAAVVPVPSSDLEKNKDARSFTDPNLNISDTDGKKAKLKPLADGTVLNNRYEIVRKIGGGGMGAVYLANDRNLGGVLRAVKEMVQSYIEEDQQEKAVNDFKRESMLLTSLDHPAIPTIFDYFYDEKEARFYLVMKYISGGDLASRLRSTPEGKINELTVTEWAMQIADVLNYLHNHEPPIVYRDLKPSNIMVDGNSGRVMLIDFGIARWVNKEERGVTAVGTMGYAPPELFSGNVEPRSDIYSLGSTMFHLLTGADPQSNPLLIFDFNKNPRPRQINSQLTDQMEQILMRAVEYNADKRFSSASELRTSLAQHLENLKQGSVSFGVIDTASSVLPLSSVPVFCGFCGQKIVASDLFCPFCGAQQPIAQQQIGGTIQPQAAYAPAPAAPTARLMVIGTSDLERSEFTLDKDSNLVGRRDPMSNIFPEIDLSKFDPQTKVSRRHARIWKDSGRFMVEDLGSSNGTVLMNANAVPVRLLPHQPKALSSGDKIKVGDTTLHFVTS